MRICRHLVIFARYSGIDGSVGTGETVGVPQTNVLLMIFDTWKPVFAGIVERWQFAAIISWQVCWADVLVQFFPIIAVEEHLERKISFVRFV